MSPGMGNRGGNDFLVQEKYEKAYIGGAGAPTDLQQANAEADQN